MKRGKIVLTLFLTLFIGAAWLLKVTTIVSDSKKYNALIKDAEHYAEEKLYQKAIIAYKSALKHKETSDIREKLIQVYTLAYSDGVVTKNEYTSELSNACLKYSKSPNFWEIIIKFYVDKAEYKNANLYLNKSMNAKAESNVLTQLKKEIYYSYSTRNKIFNEVYQSTNGYFTLYDGTQWGVMAPSGKWEYECTYQSISSVGSSMEVLLTTENDSRVVDRSQVVQKIFVPPIITAKAVSENFILIQDDGWKYFDYEKNKFIQPVYEDASIYTDGKAVVKENGTWLLIDKEGKKGEINFDDVKLYESKEYLYDGLFLASVHGKYGLYKNNGKMQTEIRGESVDLYFGGAIAFKDKSGKWGYVDKKNKIMIEPQFEEARSFSSGVAAVKKDGKWGFINSDGELVIDYQFIDVKHFNNKGMCFVSLVEGEYFPITFRLKGVQ